MSKLLAGVLATSFVLMITAACPALAWHVDGHVNCPGDGRALAGAYVQVTATGGTSFSGSATTDQSGYYFIGLPDIAAEYQATLVPPDGATLVSPSSGVQTFAVVQGSSEVSLGWIVDSPQCQAPEGLCWLTGGGTKFSSITGTLLGEAGPKHSFGGNVYPGCSADAGDGGNWNDVAHALKLHFQGREIEVVRCGNVSEIPPGSESPDTPFNFIEFRGTGRLVGIRGNPADYGTVYFFARCEDRSEPGSRGQRDDTLKDRYFLHVFSDNANPTGSTLMLVDGDGDPATVDPVTITSGNLQIHISSCDNPPPAATALLAPSREFAAGEAEASGADAAPAEGPWLAMAGPNPALDQAGFRFAVPADAEVSLAVYDLAGRRVGQVVSGRVSAGTHLARWDLRDPQGSRVARGVYFANLRVDGVAVGHRMLIVTE